VNPRFSTLIATVSFAGGLAAAELDFDREIQPVLQEFCFECHGPEKQKGDLRLDTLARDFESAETWHDALDQLKLGEMPPPKAAQPSAEQNERLASWLNSFLREAAEAKRFSEGRVSMRRLTRYEYANTMRDLLGLDLDFAHELPPEPESPDGFLNNGSTLEMSPTQIETYLKAARHALRIAIHTGEEQEVFRVEQTATAKGNLPNRKDGGHAPVNPEYILDLPKFPREGEFEVSVTAKLANPDEADFPKIVVSMGHVPGIIHVPRRTVGEAELKSPESETFVFRGRMEDFPQAGLIPFGNSGFKGMILMVDFLDADGEQLRYPDKLYFRNPPKPKKGQKPKPLPEPPPFGDRLEIEIEAAEFVGPISRPSLVKTQDQKSEIRKFAERAFRRPVVEAELKPFEALFESLRSKEVSFEESIRETFAAILVSPHFLYIAEPAEGESLTDFELATRLSYFLWSSMPDDRLIELAAEGKLKDRDVLAAEVERMMRDPRSEEFIMRFADQWFDLDALTRVAVDPNAFPNFKESLKTDFRSETHAVFAEVLRNDLSALELLDSNWTMANRNLAKHYDIPGPRSRDFERISFPADSQRGGLLGQGAFHLAGSNGEHSHPIKRAVWILDRLLDSPPASPPPDTPELDSENPDFAKLTLKQQLLAHREKESCNNCHRGIDPWGLPLENFDALGQWRASEDGSSTLPNGAEIRNPAELKAFLVSERKDWFARSAVRRLMAYGLGRSLDLGDRETADALTEAFEGHGYRFQPLIVDLVCSEVFQGK
jgi:hypothetical protein